MTTTRKRAKKFVALELQPFGFRVEVYADHDLFMKAFHGYAADAADNDFSGDAGVTLDIVFPDGTCVYLIGIFDGNSATLVHELIHLMVAAFARAGIDCRDSNGELMAYSVDHLYTLVRTAFKLK